jgi:hypothetical protein
MAFGWWDVVVDESRRFLPNPQTPALPLANIEPVIVEKRRGPRRAAAAPAKTDVPKVGNE